MSNCKSKCENEDKIRKGFEIHDCPNMKRDPKDTSMEYEYYKCDVCGKRDYLDYDQMR